MYGLKLIKVEYTQTSNIGRTLVGNKIVDHWDVVGASPIFILDLTPAFNGLGIDNYKMGWETFEFVDLGAF